jgi:hypothetical protein
MYRTGDTFKMDWLRRRPALIAVVLILTASVIGMVFVLYATQGGPGVGSDSTIYLLSAQNLLAGNGLGWMEPGGFHRLDYYPPFYPLTAAGSALLAGDVVNGTRWLNTLLFGGLAALLGGWYYRASRQPLLAGILSGMLAVSPVLVGVAVWAMSEPVFLLTGFAGLALLAAYLASPRTSTLVMAALLIGLAFLSRYLGVAFILAGALMLLLLPVYDEEPFLHRLPRSLVFGAIAALPMLIWLALDFISSGTIGGRSGMPAEMFLPRFFGTFPALEPIVLFWLLPESVADRLPDSVQMLLFLLPFVFLGGLGAWVWLKYSRTGFFERAPFTGTARLALIMALFIVVYLPVLAVLQAMIYPPVALDHRMLSPVHVAVVVLLFALAYLGSGLFTTHRRMSYTLVLLALVVFSGTYLLRGALVTREYQHNGIGYSSQAWQTSPLLEVVRALPNETPLITNDKAAILFLTGRPAYEVVEIYQDTPSSQFSSYGSGSDESQRVFREEAGALVLFNASLQEDFGSYGDRIEQRLAALTVGLYRYYEGDDGAVYFFHQPAASTDLTTR